MYNSYPYGGNPYPGGNNYQNNNQYQSYNDHYAAFQLRKQNEKNSLKKLSLLMGGAFLCYVLAQSGIVVIFELCGIMDIYRNNSVVSTCIDVLLSVVCLLLPFLAFAPKMKKISQNENVYNFSVPHSFTDSALAVVAGVGVCMLANVVTSFFTIFMSLFGMELTSPDISMPQGTTGVLINIVRTVITAAFVEEICLRGTVMGNLRQYGDRFAIMASAVMFGIMHGNLIQSPFALIAGFALGYLSIKCGSLWIAVIIHAINNGLSVFISYMIDIVDEKTALLMQAAMIYGLAFLGVICFIIFSKRTAKYQLRQNSTLLSNSEMARTFIFTPTMIISLIYMVYITSNFIEFGG